MLAVDTTRSENRRYAQQWHPTVLMSRLPRIRASGGMMLASCSHLRACWVMEMTLRGRDGRDFYGSSARLMGTKRTFFSMADWLMPRLLAAQQRNTILACLKALAISTAVKSSARSGCLTVL